MTTTYKIGTVETLRVNSSGRRFYVNLDTFTVQAYGIQPGDLLRVKIEEGTRPDNQGGHEIAETRDFPNKTEEEEDEE